MIKAKLIVVGGDAKRSEVSLKNLPVTIGRGKDASITLPHALVSRQHCEIFQEDDHLCVKDLNSLNGTYLNNQKIQGSQTLMPGQLLTLGNVTFRADYSLAHHDAQATKNPLARQASADASLTPERDQQTDIDTDHGSPNPGADTDEHIFAVNGSEPPAGKSVSLDALNDLPGQQAQVSFNGALNSANSEKIPSEVGEVKIDSGDNASKRTDPSQSSLNDFFRKLPK